MNYSVSVSGRLREERNRTGLNQTDFAAIGGVTKKTQMLYEKGERAPDTNYMSAIAAAGADVLYILTGQRIAAEAENLGAKKPDEDIYSDELNVSLIKPDKAIAMRHEREGVAKAYDDLAGNLEDIDELILSWRENEHERIFEWNEAALTSMRKSAEHLRNAALSAGEDLVLVPRHDVAGSCGNGALIHSEQIVDYLAFRREWVSKIAVDPSRLALIEAAGDSMMPTINPGDLMLLDLMVHVGRDGIYAINVDGLLYIKRVQKRFDGTVIVKSDNEAYEEQRFSGNEAKNLRIIGRVIWMGKRV